ncbi:hypothetical protein A2U01_0110019, partial [Trifolium medium]|nr:hypothetical protein [Trifolium medium]
TIWILAMWDLVLVVRAPFDLLYGGRSLLAGEGLVACATSCIVAVAASM